MSDIQDMKYVYVNGEFVQGKDAVVSVRDRGFRFGDGVFETIRVSGSQLYQWDLHALRLQRGLKAVQIDFDIDGMFELCLRLLQKNDVVEGFVRVSVSRGVGSVGFLPEIVGGATVVIETSDAVADSVDVVSLYVSGYRKIPADSLPAGVKLMQGLNSSLARMEAVRNDCFEALLLGEDGVVCEGSSSNVFWVKGDKVYTSSLDDGVVPGTLRDAVIRLSPYEVIVAGKYHLDELLGADEVFLTNVAWLVLSVGSIVPMGVVLDKVDIATEIRRLVMQDIEKHACS